MHVQALQRSAGKDVSSEFDDMHDDFAKQQLSRSSNEVLYWRLICSRYYIGDLVGPSSTEEKTQLNGTSAAEQSSTWYVLLRE